MGDLRRMTSPQARRARTLIRRLCANYDNGNCLLLDDGDLCVCPQTISDALLCRYFCTSVLPDDRELYAEIMSGVQNWKHCSLCDTRFIARSNRAVYCDICAQLERRRRTRDRVRLHRGQL